MESLAEFVIAFIAPRSDPYYRGVTFAPLRPARLQLPADLTARFEALERGPRGGERELAEAEGRRDFAERLLSKARDERRSAG